jgi:hypothetical protein
MTKVPPAHHGLDRTTAFNLTGVAIGEKRVSSRPCIMPAYWPRRQK